MSRDLREGCKWLRGCLEDVDEVQRVVVDLRRGRRLASSSFSVQHPPEEAFCGSEGGVVFDCHC
jgi:hypothetical protein